MPVKLTPPERQKQRQTRLISPGAIRSQVREDHGRPWWLRAVRARVSVRRLVWIVVSLTILWALASWLDEVKFLGFCFLC